MYYGTVGDSMGTVGVVGDRLYRGCGVFVELSTAQIHLSSMAHHDPLKQL